MNGFRHRSGFSLVELLVVIVIIGVMAMVVGPTFTTGSDVARMRTAARGAMQMSRYARTMAVLHQTPVDLTFGSDGTVSVVQAGGGGESLVSAKAFAVTNAAVAAEEEDAAREARTEEAAAAEAASAGGGGGESYVMAVVNAEKKYENVTFHFEGYTDTLDERRGVGREEEESSEEDVQTVRIRYKSNGTCRPYRLRVSAGEDGPLTLTVVVDVLGAARIEEDDE